MFKMQLLSFSSRRKVKRWAVLYPVTPSWAFLVGVLTPLGDILWAIDGVFKDLVTNFMQLKIYCRIIAAGWVI